MPEYLNTRTGVARMSQSSEKKDEAIERQNLWRFLAFAKPYRWLIVLLIVVGVTRFALQFVTPWGIGFLLDHALTDAAHLAPPQRGPRLEQVHWIGLLLTLALLARCFAQYGESMLTNRLGNRLVFDLRRRLYTHIHRLSLSFFDSR